MIGLALRSLRYRASAFAASFLAMWLGAIILMTFASMLDTAAGPGVDEVSKQALSLMATIVGGWGMLIVVFAVTSTLTLSVRQRGREMALLKSIGATPGQVGSMIVVEAGLVALVAAALAIPFAAVGGALLLSVLKDTGQVATGIGYGFGSIAIQMGLGITFVAAVAAALLTARRVTRMRARDALADASMETSGMGRVRLIAAWVFLGAGLSCGVVTATVFNGKGIDAMAVGGQAAILSSIGLALFAPVLLRSVTAVLAAPLRGAGAAGYLTVINVRRRTQQMAGALVPIILFTGIATGTLYMQGIENSAMPSAGTSTTAADAKAIETLNFVVVGMIALFAAIMLINTLIAATTYRRQEFGQQRLIGSTPGQVLRMVGFEGAALAITGVLFGSLAAVVAIVPYSLARTGTVFPEMGLALYLGIAGTALALTMAASLTTARRTLTTPAVEAASA
ncbi:FtsX-like permease family protein [Kribbella deserti]|uniref:FtsX-like permease family protein n=1 Tax=Kribbella deserti TaxID=1926257 RepID=A0ABV6QGV3_9ACTN